MRKQESLNNHRYRVEVTEEPPTVHYFLDGEIESSGRNKVGYYGDGAPESAWGMVYGAEECPREENMEMKEQQRKPPSHLSPLPSPVARMHVEPERTAVKQIETQDVDRRPMFDALLPKQFAIFGIICQTVFIVIFAVMGNYSPQAMPILENGNKSNRAAYTDGIDHYYPMFQDVHVMIFVGFGFLMTFLKRYGYSAVGINFFLAAFVIEWALIVRGLFALNDHGNFKIGINELLSADFSAAVVLISMGAVLGKVSPTQYLMMALLETALSVANEYIVFHLLKVNDVGGSIVVHTFGAYFGIAVSRALNRDVFHEHPAEDTVYHSDIFSMIGTMFLWIFWPSFNASVAAPLDARDRAVVNTLLSLTGSSMTSFLVSSLLDKHGKFTMNATLAGGVAIGTAANLILKPFGALIIGSFSGIFSVLGYQFLTPFLASKLGAHDTCGVNNLHGMPGILAAIIGAIATVFVKKESYGTSMVTIFPAMSEDAARTSGVQAAYQMLALGVTLAICIIGGVLTGLLMRLNIWNNVSQKYLYDDEKFWTVPEDFTKLKSQ